MTDERPPRFEEWVAANTAQTYEEWIAAPPVPAPVLPGEIVMLPNPVEPTFTPEQIAYLGDWMRPR